MEKTREYLKSVFQNGDRPSEQDFIDLIDSFYNPTDDGGVEVDSATTTQEGIAERATLSEVEQGSDNSRFVTPAGAKRAAEKHAPVLSVNGETGNVSVGVTQPKDESVSLGEGFHNYTDGPDRAGGWQEVRVSSIGNLVVLSGLVFSEGLSDMIMLLPEHIRPSATLLFKGHSSDRTYNIWIRTDGKVMSDIGENEWLSLSGIVFVAEPNGEDR